MSNLYTHSVEVNKKLKHSHACNAYTHIKFAVSQSSRKWVKKRENWCKSFWEKCRVECAFQIKIYIELIG